MKKKPNKYQADGVRLLVEATLEGRGLKSAAPSVEDAALTLHRY